jgi:tetratricopeptide (TPR) repeat protein
VSQTTEILAASPASQAPVLDPRNPFAGLQAFGEGDQTFFHGRDAERQDLFRLVRREVLTVLFGRSGLGKTSLLQAGLFPLLREASFLPLLIRLDFTPGDSLEGRLKDRIAEVLHEQGVEGPPPDRGTTLWQYFHQTRWWSARNRLLTPVLVIDQFEEIFTLGRGDTRVSPFLTELADLIENRIPAVVRERFGTEDLPFSYDRQTVRVVLALREDFLPHLEGLRPLLPSLARNRFRLTPMRGPQALECIRRPAGDLIDEPVALEILRFVTGEARESLHLDGMEVEPALLSLFCRELNEKRLEQGLPAITAGLVQGARGRILSDFYERSLAGLRKEVRPFIEDRLLTASGFRHSEPLEEALRQPRVTEEALARLVDRRLLRLEPRLGRLHVELIHDVLTPVVQESRDRRRSRERRHRQLRRAAAVLALLGGLSVAAGLAALRDLRLRKEAEADRGRAETVINFILSDFSSQLRSRGKLGLLKDTQKAAVRYFQSLPAEEDSPASARSRVMAYTEAGNSLLFQGKVDLAVRFLRQGTKAAEDLAAMAPGDPAAQEQLAAAHRALGYALYIGGDFPGSRASFAQALVLLGPLAARSPSEPSRQMALADSWLASYEPLFAQREYGPAAEHLSQGLQILERLARRNLGDRGLAVGRSDAETHLAMVLFARGEAEPAVQILSRSLSRLEPIAVQAPGDPAVQNRLAQAYAFAGTLAAARGDRQGGLTFCRQAVHLHESVQAIDPSSAAAAFNLANSDVSLARLLLAQGNLPEALEHAVRAREIRRRIASGTPRNPNSLWILGEAHDLIAAIEKAQGQTGRAREEWTRGVEALAPVAATTDHLGLLEVYGKMLLALGRTEEARPVARRVLGTGKATPEFQALARSLV